VQLVRLPEYTPFPKTIFLILHATDTILIAAEGLA